MHTLNSPTFAAHDAAMKLDDETARTKATKGAELLAAYKSDIAALELPDAHDAEHAARNAVYGMARDVLELLDTLGAVLDVLAPGVVTEREAELLEEAEETAKRENAEPAYVAGYTAGHTDAVNEATAELHALFERRESDARWDGDREREHAELLLGEAARACVPDAVLTEEQTADAVGQFETWERYGR